MSHPPVSPQLLFRTVNDDNASTPVVRHEYVVDAEREQELEQFRQQWAQEVAERKRQQQSSTTSAPSIEQLSTQLERITVTETNVGDVDALEKQTTTTTTTTSNMSAIECYTHAVYMERTGRLGDALTFYQQAFRLDPEVDLTFKNLGMANDPSIISVDKLSKRAQSEDVYERFIQVGDDYISRKTNKKHLQKQPFYQLLMRLRQTPNLTFIPKDETKISPLQLLPVEVLERIIKYIALLDVRALLRLGRASRRLTVLVHEPSIWKLLCQSAYVDVGGMSMDMLERHLTRYVGDWRLMYIERPRLRTNGIYIATCHYIRQGLSENTFNQPVHLVTYYRYIRFLPGGVCLMKLTADEPALVVRTMRPDVQDPHMVRGRWELSEDQLTISAPETQRPWIIDWMRLQLKSTSRGRHNKLSWIEYYSVNTRRDHQLTHYPMHQLKSYFFSRVLSFRT